MTDHSILQLARLLYLCQSKVRQQSVHPGGHRGGHGFQGGTREEAAMALAGQFLGRLRCFVRWALYKTGVPLIDANMKELAMTGFMSNRGRQNVASLLTKDLYYDWRLGAEWFESLLIDYDPRVTTATGSAIARIAGRNMLRYPELFEEEIKMYVHEEQVGRRQEPDRDHQREHENVKYLPGISLPENVVAVSSAVEAAAGADLLIFVLPHQVRVDHVAVVVVLPSHVAVPFLPPQFIPGVCQELKGKVAKNAKAISMIKGVEVKDGTSASLPTSLRRFSGADARPCREPILPMKVRTISRGPHEIFLSHSPLAAVAQDKFSETTIGYREGDLESAEVFWKVFDTPTFKVGMVEDVAGVSLCGALKNVVAIAAGFTDGLGWGDNAKGAFGCVEGSLVCSHPPSFPLSPPAAAVMRIGLMEMKHFSEEFFEGVKPETFTETSAGIADLITTCEFMAARPARRLVADGCFALPGFAGGRNRKCAEAFVKTGKSFDQLEKELLNGQKLQGSETAREVHNFLQARGKVDDYPLFKAVYSIAFEGGMAKELTSKL
ncbi:hypothetical protein L7F22_023726 [Adiantum nelumboides]|nr:hypothetical protein [Adiantum nelumboides]